MSAANPRTLRFGAVLLAVAATALAWGGGAPPFVRVLAVDGSRSVSGDGEGRAGAEAEAARGLPAGGTLVTAPESGGDPFPGETDLESLILGALSLVPPGARGEILLATDGRATRGEAAAAVAEARRRGVAIRALPLGARGLPARVAALEAPSVVRAGDRFPVSVVVTGSAGAATRISLEDAAAGESEEREVLLPAGGRARVVFARAAGTPGVRRFRAGGAEAAVLVEGRAALLRIGRGPAAPGVADLLRRVGGGEFLDGPLDGADLPSLAAVVLDDLPESSLPPDGGERLRGAVAGGLGLAVLGGPSTLGPGGFAGRPLEEALPVRTAPERPRPLLVLAVDVSGSMESTAGAARKAAVDLAGRLPGDARLALVYFHDGLAGTAGPFDLSEPAGREGAAAEAAQVRAAGGGTRFGAAAEGALGAAARAPGAGARTLLLVTDGRPAEEEGELAAIAGSLREARFLLRVVTVGADPDLSRLRSFAGADGVLATGAAELSRVLGSAAGAADPSLWKPGASAVRAGPDAPPFGAVPAGLPDVDGFDRVFPRREGRVWLALGGGEPLLAGRTVGLGRSLVFAAAPGAGAGAWASAPADAFLGEALRWVLRSPGGEGVEASAQRRPDGTVNLRVEALAASAPAGEVRGAGVPLRRTGPATWEGRVPAGTAGPVVAFESGGVLLARAAVAAAPSAEDLALGPDGAALSALQTPGRGPPGGSGAGTLALAAALAALALLLGAAFVEGGHPAGIRPSRR